MATSVVGLDIGNGVLRAAEVSDPGKGRPTLLRYHSIAVAPSAVARGEVLEPNVVSTALKQLWSQGGFKSKKVVLGVGNARTLVRDVAVPRMPLQQIRESLPFQVQELLPVPVADALLDFYPISSGTGEGGEIINGLLIAAVKDPVLKNVDAVQGAGLEPVEVDLVPFALTRALMTADAAGTVVLVHIGAVTSCVVIAQDGVPQFVRIIPSGGEDVSAALVKQLGVSAEQADQIKRGLGLATQGVTPEWRPAVDTISSAVGDLLDSVRHTLSFYVNTRSDAAFSRVLLSGGGAQLPGLPQAMAEATRLPVGMPDPRAALAFAKSVDQAKVAADSAGVAVAAGLAMGSKE